MNTVSLSKKLFEKGKVFTLSNFMSFIRLAGAFYLYHVTMQHQAMLAIIVTLLLVFTDFADGYFARKFNQVSELGKVLDPLADKVCSTLVFIALYLEYGLPFWILAVIVGRDIAILLGSAFLITKLPYVTPSAMPGKIAVTVLAMMYLVYLIGYEPLKQPLEWLALVMIVISSLHYGYLFLKRAKENH